MGDVCQPFYYDALGLERVASKRRALRVSFSFAICGQIKVVAEELHFQNLHGCFHPFGSLLHEQKNSINGQSSPENLDRPETFYYRNVKLLYKT